MLFSLRLFALPISIIAIPITLALLGAGCAAPTTSGERQPPPAAHQWMAAAAQASLDPGLVAIRIPPARIEPDAEELLREATALLSAGEYEQAADRYRSVIAYAPGSSEAGDARFNLGVIAHTTSDYGAAAAAFAQFRQQHPSHGKARLALFWLAESYRNLGAGAEALAAYDAFLAHYPQVEDHVRAKRAEILAQQQDAAGAARELDAAAAAGAGANPDLRRRQADGLVKQDRPAAAARIYLELAGDSAAWARSELLYLAAQALRSAGDRAHADLYTQIIREHPSSYYAKLALDAARTAGSRTVSPYQEGRVLYYQRQDAEALEAFLRQQRTLPDHPETPWSYYRAALVYERMGRNDEALAALDTLLARTPTGEAAEEGLWEKALLLDYLGRFEDASAVYKDYYARFPQSVRAKDAAFKEGLSHYRSRNMQAAAESWTRAGHEPRGATTGGRTGLWLAKALTALGDRAGAQEALQEAQDPKPGRYYALRAGGAAVLPPAAANYRPLDNGITDREDGEVRTWLAAWSGTAPLTAVITSTDPRVQRGLLLQEMGLRSEATQHFRAIIRAMSKDPAALYAIARILHERGEHAAATMAAYTIWELAPTRDPRELPGAILKLLYPVPYGELVVQAAREWKVDPLFLYALMRQESNFNAHATSSASARGLTQVMPATGQDIAKRLGLSSFSTDDLYRPGLSIRFGAYYAARQLEYLGNPMFALAAYNAGAGAALRWMNNDRSTDPDLFLETIDYAETASYVRIVMENYAYYTRLYGSR